MYHNLYLIHPFTMLISGPTGCGKTQWVTKLINNCNTYIKPEIKRVTYCYGEFQSAFTNLKNTRLIQGLPDDIISKFNGDEPELLIIDDLMHEASNSKTISEIFTKGSHHRNLSVILLIQNFFIRGSEIRNISLNTQYIVLFKNPRDQTIASNIARQMFPRKVDQFQKVYEDATERPFSYLFIDLKSTTHKSIRLLTNVLGEDYIIAYQLV